VDRFDPREYRTGNSVTHDDFHGTQQNQTREPEL
jgi:hypothetical protein